MMGGRPASAFTYGDREVMKSVGTRPLDAARLRHLVREMDASNIPDGALVEVRTPIAGDRRRVDLAVWLVDDTTTEKDEHQP